MVERLFRRIFGGEKKEEKADVEMKLPGITELQKICGTDKETYKALQNTMFLDPTKVTSTMEEAAKKATMLEKEKDVLKARVWYHIAGSLALWKGNVPKVKEYYGKCAKLAPEMEYELVTKIPEKAVEKAQEYYKKYLA